MSDHSDSEFHRNIFEQFRIKSSVNELCNIAIDLTEDGEDVAIYMPPLGDLSDEDHYIDDSEEVRPMIADIPLTLLVAEGEMLATNHHGKISDESLDPALTDSLPPAKKAKLAPTVYKWTKKDCDNLIKRKWKEYSKYNSEDPGLSLRYNQDLIDMNKAYSPHEIAALLFFSDEVYHLVAI